jgi:3-isopropylmalate/(R)-2-methylmalate dehydratase large subunit
LDESSNRLKKSCGEKLLNSDNSFKDFTNKILDDQGLTFSEKILSIKRVDEPKKRSLANDIIVSNVDIAMSQDGTTPLAIKVLHELGVKRVWDPKKVVLVIDHTYPASSEQVANFHSVMRRFAREQGCHIHEGSICHQYMLEKFIVPGMVAVGADSHTTSQGSLGAFATGIGSTEIASVWTSGKIWFRVPESIKIIFNGKIPKGVFAKDLVLHVIGKLTTEGATYKAVEFTGQTVKKMSMDSRATLCNMILEAGAKTGIVEPDSITFDYLNYVGRDSLISIHSGSNAEYSSVMEENVIDIAPLVALPNSPGNVKPVSEIGKQPIDQAFLGSCTNGRLEDLTIAAQMLRKRKVHHSVRLIVTPASRIIYESALNKGIITEFIKAGAVVTSPTCGACVGTHCGVLGPDEVCVSTSNRNFIGRMGARDAKIFLASPATVVASAINGYITDPREYME